jgi:hypothetical protein
MTEQTYTPPWALDFDGRDFTVGDHVRLLGGIVRPEPIYCMVMGFYTNAVDPETHQADDQQRCVYLADPTENGAVLMAFPGECVRVTNGPDHADVVAQAELHLADPVFRPGDVVGVLDLGPAELQGRTGEVTMTAWSDSPHSAIGQGQPDALYVVTDIAHEGWCKPEHLALISPAPLPGAVSESIEAQGW